MVKVTQADREMAALVLFDDWREHDARMVREDCACDDWQIVQLFARHREAAIKQRDAEIAEVLSPIWSGLRVFQMAQKGSGSDGNLWQRYNDALSALFPLTVWAKKRGEVDNA